MLLKEIGEPLGNAKKVLESDWEMPKGYWIVSGQFLEAIGKLLRNAQVELISKGQMLILGGGDKTRG
jgi:hypothetical protein